MSKKMLMFEFLSKYKKSNSEDFTYDIDPKKIDHFLSKTKYAILNNHKIFIWGDYDVDGIGSTALMVDILRDYADHLDLTVDIEYHIPSRADGYGIKRKSFLQLSSSADLIITLDNGTHKEFFQALSVEEKENILIIDHHPNGDFSDEICVINPNPDGSVKICTGVLVEAIFKGFREQDPEYAAKRGEAYFRDIVAMTLISDVASLNNDRVRKTVIEGLQIIKKRGRALFKQLLPEFRGDPTMTDLAFNVIPVVNSIGRLSDSPSWAVEVMLARKNTDESRALIDNALAVNNMRKSMTDEYSRKIFWEIEDRGMQNDELIHIHMDDIQVGINGIIAANIFNRYGKDTIITSKNYSGEGGIVGSGRGVAIRSKLEEISKTASDAFSFGGHNQAVGIRIFDIEAFKNAKINFNNAIMSLGENRIQSIRKFVLEDPVSVADFKEMCFAYNIFNSGDVKFADQFFVRVQGAIFSKKEYKNDFLKIGLVDSSGEKIYLLTKRDEKIDYTSLHESIYELEVQPASKKDMVGVLGTTMRRSNTSVYGFEQDVESVIVEKRGFSI